MPCPQCGSKHFLVSGLRENPDVVIFYCMADGCGHEWEVADKNSKKKMEVEERISVSIDQ